jgi:hypothetical protein
MQILQGEFTFAVPAGHPQAGEKIAKTFQYEQVDTEQEAMGLIAARGWQLGDILNNVLKQDARNKAYQAAILPYRASDVSEDDIQERMVRDFIRLGFTEDQARANLAMAAAQRHPQPVAQPTVVAPAVVRGRRTVATPPAQPIIQAAAKRAGRGRR